jgi:hypothetical protein
MQPDKMGCHRDITIATYPHKKIMKGVADSTTLEEEEKRGRKMIPSQQLQQLQLQSERKNLNAP